MKFVAVALVVAAASFTPVVTQAGTIALAAKSKSYEQCYKDCTARGGKPRSCGTQCQNKS